MGHIHNWATLFWPEIFGLRHMSPRHFGQTPVWATDFSAIHITGPQKIWPKTQLGHRHFGQTHNWATEILATRNYLATDISATRNIFAMGKTSMLLVTKLSVAKMSMTEMFMAKMYEMFLAGKCVWL